MLKQVIDMLQKEFEDRTKLRMSSDEFNGVNALYMACGDDIDKDEFCKMYMSFEGRVELIHRIERIQTELRLMLHECREMLSDAADGMLQIGDELCTGRAQQALDEKAAWLVGRKEVVRRKAAHEYAFSKEDLEYINNNLK